MLAILNYNKVFKVHTDATKFARKALYDIREGNGGHHSLLTHLKTLLVGSPFHCENRQ